MYFACKRGRSLGNPRTKHVIVEAGSAFRTHQTTIEPTSRDTSECAQRGLSTERRLAPPLCGALRFSNRAHGAARCISSKNLRLSVLRPVRSRPNPALFMHALSRLPSQQASVLSGHFVRADSMLTTGGGGKKLGLVKLRGCDPHGPTGRFTLDLQSGKTGHDGVGC